MKLARLQNILSSYGSVLVAYSGGVDSTFLLKVSRDCLGRDKVLAVTAVSETYPPEELALAKKIARMLDVRHRVIRTREINDPRFRANPPNRCYYCKRELFSSLKRLALKQGLGVVVDASNASDLGDFRPGSKAKRELGIRSPLQEADLGKGDIRRISRKLALPTWDKPSLACLASRLPYGTRILPEALKKINRAERYLRGLGFPEVRLRHYQGLCRIEVPKLQVKALVAKSQKVISGLKKLGYNYITVDLEGYRTGSMNEALKKG